MRLGSLCTGIGGLDLAVCQVLDADPVWCSEIDAGANAVLAARFAGVANVGDFTVADLEPVDVLTGGFPCQPVSQAGKRKAMDDDRWLFDDILTAVRAMDPPPRLLVFENVPGLLSAAGGDAMARVVEGLASCGYVGRYGVLGSSAVGGCHRRERVWIVAAHSTRPERGGTQQPHLVETRWSTAEPRERPSALLPTPRTTDSDGAGAHGDVGLDLRTAVNLLPTPVVNDMGAGKTPEEWDEWTDRMRAAHGNGNGHGKSLAIEAARLLPTDRFGQYAPAVERWAQTIGRPAPAPSSVNAKGKARLSPDFVEWMMGYPEGWTDVGISRTARLRCLGNSVQPQTAAAAIAALTGQPAWQEAA